MNLRCRARSAVLTAAVAAALVPAGSAIAAPPAHGFIKPPCARSAAGQMRCFLLYRPQVAVDQARAVRQSVKPHGWTPAELRAAYKLPNPSTSHQTVAVSIPFH